MALTRSKAEMEAHMKAHINELNWSEMQALTDTLEPSCLWKVLAQKLHYSHCYDGRNVTFGSTAVLQRLEHGREGPVQALLMAWGKGGPKEVNMGILRDCLVQMGLTDVLQRLKWPIPEQRATGTGTATQPTVNGLLANYPLEEHVDEARQLDLTLQIWFNDIEHRKATALAAIKAGLLTADELVWRRYQAMKGKEFFALVGGRLAVAEFLQVCSSLPQETSDMLLRLQRAPGEERTALQLKKLETTDTLYSELREIFSQELIDNQALAGLATALQQTPCGCKNTQDVHMLFSARPEWICKQLNLDMVPVLSMAAALQTRVDRDRNSMATE